MTPTPPPFDVTMTLVPVADRAVLGEEFRIEESTLSDCLNLKAPPEFVMPRYPEVLMQARAAVLRRDTTRGASAVRYDYEEVWNPGGRLSSRLLDSDLRWLQAVHVELGPLPSGAITGWPHSVMPEVKDGLWRTSITRPW